MAALKLITLHPNSKSIWAGGHALEPPHLLEEHKGCSPAEALLTGAHRGVIADRISWHTELIHPTSALRRLGAKRNQESKGMKGRGPTANPLKGRDRCIEGHVDPL